MLFIQINDGYNRARCQLRDPTGKNFVSGRLKLYQKVKRKQRACSVMTNTKMQGIIRKQYTSLRMFSGYKNSYKTQKIKINGRYNKNNRFKEYYQLAQTLS